MRWNSQDRTTTPVDEAAGQKTIALLERLEEHDDVQAVHANMELPEKLLAEVTRSSA